MNNFSFILPEGTYAKGKITIKYTDIAGNSGKTYNATTWVIDKTVPAAPVLKLLNDTGSSITDGISADGTIDVSNLESNSTWKYSLDSGVSWHEGIGNAFVVPAGVYAKGQIRVEESDIAGNKVQSTLGAITIDSGVSTPTLTLAEDTGSSSTDAITSNGTINVSGLEIDATWKYSLDGGSTWATGTGTSFIVPAGTYAEGQVKVQQTDIAGNSATQSLGALTVDTTIATPTIVLNDTGVSNQDYFTYDFNLRIENVEPGAKLEYSLDGGNTWKVSSDGLFAAKSNTTYAADMIQVRQTDTAGNVSSVAKISHEVTFYNSGHQVDAFLASDTGTVGDFITSNGLVNVDNLPKDYFDKWLYSTDGGVTFSEGSGTAFILGEGRYEIDQIIVMSYDTAGN